MSSFDIAILIIGGGGICIAVYGLILSHQMDVLRREETASRNSAAPHPGE